MKNVPVRTFIRSVEEAIAEAELQAYRHSLKRFRELPDAWRDAIEVPVFSIAELRVGVEVSLREREQDEPEIGWSLTPVAPVVERPTLRLKLAPQPDRLALDRAKTLLSEQLPIEHEQDPEQP